MAMRALALLLVTATLSCFDIGARAQQDCCHCGQPPADICMHMEMCQSEYHAVFRRHLLQVSAGGSRRQVVA
jgi:hypothetical protein